MKYYIKVITGFREDQFVTIPMQEAHKAYYLFNHPEERGVFENGVALIGRNIQEIRPDYNATLGYNPTYQLSGDDWNQFRNKGIDSKMNSLLQVARDVSLLIESKPYLIREKLESVIKTTQDGKYLLNDTILRLGH